MISLIWMFETYLLGSFFDTLAIPWTLEVASILPIRKGLADFWGQLRCVVIAILCQAGYVGLQNGPWSDEVYRKDKTVWEEPGGGLPLPVGVAVMQKLRGCG